MVDRIKGKIPSAMVRSPGMLTPEQTEALNQAELGTNRDETGQLKALSEAFQSGQSGTEFIQSWLKNFKGDYDQLERFLEFAAPFMNKLEGNAQVRKIEGSGAYAHAADQSNWDLGAMGAYGQQAGTIGAQTRAGMQQAEQGAAAGGFGRSSMRSAMAQMIKQQGITAQSNAFASAQQRAAQNRMSSAMNMMDIHRTIAQVALGQQITPRTGGGGGEAGVSTGAAMAAGAMTGAGALAPLGGVGALAGAGGGALLGLIGNS